MTPKLGQFLNAINGFVKEQNESGLADFLVIEPPFNQTYLEMVEEVRQAYPKGSEEALEEKCTKSLTVASNGLNGSASWTMFIKFMAQYLSYLRDVDADPNKYLETYELLYELQKRANSALVHPSLGQIMIQTVISCAKLICRLAIGLDKQPELIAHLKSSKPGGEDGGRETLPERTAETIRQALTTCLNDRTSDLDQNGRPEGKKRGIYIIANICLKIFFQCRKTRNAEMIFTTIRNNSPPLAAYPKAQRVTYLYYLGRYWFQNNHFHRAQLALDEAYNESPINELATRQRRHILIYLITCNITMGRFPSNVVFQRPEAQGLRERFMPIMLAIRSGDLTLFRQYLDLDGPNAPWFLHFRILFQLRNRCEVLVWRSLIRKVWILNGTRYEPGAKTAPLVDVHDLLSIFRLLEKQAQKPQDTAYIDPDLDGDDEGDEDPDALLPTLSSIESILSSLVDQGFLRGFIAHRQQKFVITGAKQAGGDVLAAGFPPPWKVVQGKVVGLEEVPGWKKMGGGLAGMATGGISGGMVVNLSGARASGAA
ncbi:hypothetical protein M409DRAFT_62124 [Zasmidium cellare ATCC 36951]|uniref:PCI domain-containing protein n=1 Tax=Zasmidium cellare ATCC 36951 TaxID=1080233 RepID=A0A6A6D6V4_ZASCE|nr:uncharacterized protein M409DRAFT_62124 [Zasmidium cellare ATCC 36951]KAF2173899.1 hypothetical protein M409DRAFT_62124 [Zasmidium cellare ATCC 36951]